MASPSLATVVAPTNPIELVPLPTADGIVVYVSVAAAEVWRAQRRISVRLDLVLDTESSAVCELREIDAARQYATTIGTTIGGAKAIVYRARIAHKFTTSGDGRDRRIDRSSFEAWLNAERDRVLGRDD